MILENSCLSSFFTEVKHRAVAVLACTICTIIYSLSETTRFSHRIERPQNLIFGLVKTIQGILIPNFKLMAMKSATLYLSQARFALNDTVRHTHLAAKCRQPHDQLNWVHVMGNNHELSLSLNQLHTKLILGILTPN
jgi:hypothetical protein